ncbi:MAG: hypothetical protein K8S13_14310 [Desulfobacula sp.]|uniref:hypothetical protein n=1 Tax=Desulfobacula sp. TaxID=2593537 RepID=UPI0025B80AF3|nr:hypothetical protein [Desulfobacula sp.]MCD4721011.1 hypothetical protein [Desulfobacula sp.]
MNSNTFLIVLISMMVVNAIYSFLPTKLQTKPIIRFFAILAAGTILVWGVGQVVQNFKNKIYAHVSINGEILESKNFPWEISYHENEKENKRMFLIDGRYGDSSIVTAKFEGNHPKYEIINATYGVAIIFFCKKEELKSFWVYIKNP